MNAPTVVQVIAGALADRGVRRAFGVPGGGSSLELAAALLQRGIDWVLTHGETPAAIMAGVTAELTGAPGVVSTGLGPGAASVVNGAAYATLDRTPLLVVTDRFSEGALDHVTHQRVDHAALLAPVTKRSEVARSGRIRTQIAELLDAAMAPPAGAVHLDLSLAEAGATSGPDGPAQQPTPSPPTGDVRRLAELLEGAHRPSLIAGIQSRTPANAAALRTLAEGLGCPVHLTYKARGVLPFDHPCHAGVFTGGRGEALAFDEADLLVLYGVDPVEIVAGPWPYTVPVVELVEVLIHPPFVPVAASVIGPLHRIVETLAPLRGGRIRPRVPLPPARDVGTVGAGIAPDGLVEAVARAAPPDARIAVDAGAHMFPCVELWPARRPFDVLISNGLSTMGFALPAAIASALAEPSKRCIALTGDGGLAMCMAELATAARAAVPIVVVVFNDGALSLIDVKRQQRSIRTPPLRYPPIDFHLAAKAMGCSAWKVEGPENLDDVLATAFGCAGPAVVDARVDPSTYRRRVEAVRGPPTT